MLVWKDGSAAINHCKTEPRAFVPGLFLAYARLGRYTASNPPTASFSSIPASQNGPREGADILKCQDSPA
jgi:hypothetical protein